MAKRNTGSRPDLAAATLSGDLRTAIMDRIRSLDMSWGMMPQTLQQALVYEISDLCEHLVRSTVELVAADGRHALKAACGEVKHNRRGFIEAKIFIQKDDTQRYALFDAVGEPLMIVIADAQEYIGERGPEPTDPDQTGLFGRHAA